MDIEAKIRYLARSSYWQNLYNCSKEISSIQLFENQNNISGLQGLFLFWLSIYSSLYTDLSQKEWDNLDESVINNDIRCDAFLYWKSQYRDKELKEHRIKNKISKLNLKDKTNATPYSVNFT